MLKEPYIKAISNLGKDVLTDSWNSNVFKLSDSINKKKIANHLDINNLVSGKQYGFCSSRSPADDLNIIMHRISAARDSKLILRLVPLDISKTLDKLWHSGLLHTHSSYGMSGKDFAIIKSFIAGKYAKVIVMVESHEINSDVP